MPSKGIFEMWRIISTGSSRRASNLSQPLAKGWGPLKWLLYPYFKLFLVSLGINLDDELSIALERDGEFDYVLHS
jgi:hypothetical protein